MFNCNMSEMFDMICGTSTGGIIALALSIGKRAEDIADLYFHKGPLIFPNGNRIISWLRKKQQVFLKSNTQMKFSKKNCQTSLDS
ncbi:MAG: patatin-like phospholipase family protein [Ignavibacteria bacterium]|nr:patatin-like phospholipase family protein [Ignavibacteria bacterium]